MSSRYFITSIGPLVSAFSIIMLNNTFASMAATTGITATTGMAFGRQALVAVLCLIVALYYESDRFGLNVSRLMWSIVHSFILLGYHYQQAVFHDSFTSHYYSLLNGFLIVGGLFLLVYLHRQSVRYMEKREMDSLQGTFDHG